MNIVVTKMNKPWNKRYYIQSSNQNNIMINECLIRKLEFAEGFRRIKNDSRFDFESDNETYNAI